MKKQLIILWIGIGLVVLAGLFPPLLRGRNYSILFSGYGTIDLARLAVEVFIVALLTAGVLYTMKKTDGK